MSAMVVNNTVDGGGGGSSGSNQKVVIERTMTSSKSMDAMDTKHKKRLSISRNSLLLRTKTSFSSRSATSSGGSSSALSSRGTSPERHNSNKENEHHNQRKSSKRSKNDQYYQDFKDLEQELTRFLSKVGVHKSNVLRLALLPFLRQQRASTFDSEESSFRIKVFQKWWLSILEALRDRSHPVAGSDRSAYLEAISGIMARKEWIQSNATTRYIFESLLYDTVKLVISKLCLKTVPLSLAAFSGKVLAFAYFWAPGVAPVLLHLLQINLGDVDRIFQVSFENSQENLDDGISQVREKFPLHLSRLVGLTKGVGLKKVMSDGSIKLLRPKPPAQLVELYGPWARRWNCQNSDVFTAFLKHYYTLLSELLPQDGLKWNAHLAAPGLLMLHGYLLSGLDSIVHPARKESRVASRGGVKPADEFNTIAVTPIPGAVSGKNRVDQLKLLGTIREILHNDDECVQYYENYCRQFERILHAVALRVPLYEVECCMVFTDLVEEYLGSLILAHSLSKHRVQIEKDNAIDWEFWIQVVQKMLSSDNSHTELRALAFLFNVWAHIPIGTCMQEHTGDKSNNDLDQFLSRSQDGLRWNVTCWLLSNQMWKQYFCHWQPLVRTYYQRLICWRVASIGTESDLLSSILFSNYNTDSRSLLKQRLLESYAKISRLVEESKRDGKPMPSLDAAQPVVNRKLGILNNPASTSSSNSVTNSNLLTLSSSVSSASLSSSPQRVNMFDVFDDIAYSYRTSMPPSELFPTDVATARNSDETVRTTNIDTQSVVDVPESSKTPTPTTQATTSTNNNSPSSGSGGGGLFAGLRRKWNKLTGGGGGSTTLQRQDLQPPSPPTEANPAIRQYHSTTNLQETASKFSSRVPSPSHSSLSSTPPSFTHTPVSGASSTSTPPSPRSVKSFTLSSSGAKSAPQTPKKKKKIPPKTSLTMHLIPPPPQLLRAKPEISRPSHKFGLEPCEKSISRQKQLLTGRRFTEFKQSPSKPRLPFEQSRTYFDDILGEFDDEQDQDGEGDDEELIVDDCPNKADDIKYWKYSGRALSEWSEAVIEFEEYVKSRKMYGATRLEDISAPFMVAEVPAKLKAG